MNKVVKYFIAFLSGAVVLIIFATFQKISIGAPLILKGYMVPTIFGGISGLLLGIWVTRLKETQQTLRKLNEELDLKVLERTKELKDALEKIKILKEQEKENIYHATAYGTQHILNNLLNKLALVKLEIDKNPTFNQNVADQFDEMKKQAQELVINLTSIEEIDEQKIKDSVYPK